MNFAEWAGIERWLDLLVQYISIVLSMDMLGIHSIQHSSCTCNVANSFALSNFCLHCVSIYTHSTMSRIMGNVSSVYVSFFLFRAITNKYMILAPPRGQDVEWGYCFDVHLNAFFPLLMILHLFQIVFLNCKWLLSHSYS